MLLGRAYRAAGASINSHLVAHLAHELAQAAGRHRLALVALAGNGVDGDVEEAVHHHPECLGGVHNYTLPDVHRSLPHRVRLVVPAQHWCTRCESPRQMNGLSGWFDGDESQ
jgi:hypothetical protein